jgi:Uma2 family endonuclease
MAATPWVKPEDYLAAERVATEKHEYFDGRISQRPSADRDHSVIATNLVLGLHEVLRQQGRHLMGSDMRVRAGPAYVYPDLSIVCGEGTYEDDHADVLLDPVAIVEVLSKSTEAYDRGLKFAHYQRIPSLHTYVLVSSTEPRVEVFERIDEGWLLRVFQGLEATATLARLNVSLPLAEVYFGVDVVAGPGVHDE